MAIKRLRQSAGRGAEVGVVGPNQILRRRMQGGRPRGARLQDARPGNNDGLGERRPPSAPMRGHTALRQPANNWSSVGDRDCAVMVKGKGMLHVSDEGTAAGPLRATACCVPGISIVGTVAGTLRHTAQQAPGLSDAGMLAGTLQATALRLPGVSDAGAAPGTPTAPCAAGNQHN